MGPIEDREVLGYFDEAMLEADPTLVEAGVKVGDPFYAATDEEVAAAEEDFALAPRQDDEDQEDCESCSA